ncbi:MAG: Na/Pi cotransporter family protein [Kiritimatiellae bacterium]|nr:Na/Pi cotransporter family protein [Kiritimatiellia bacterium]
MDGQLVSVIFKAIGFQVLGGLGIFLLGMKYMSEGMQNVAGDKLRNLIGLVANNRIFACIIGTLVTCVVQSSSVVTVMVIGFVNAGFMTLMQSIGVIIGANIGTTITGWILALKIGKFGLPILGIFALVYLFSKKDRTKYTAMAIMGIGMVFFGLETMAAGFKTPEIKMFLHDVFMTMSTVNYFGVLKCALVGCVTTMIVQSSSATLGITIAIAQTGVISLETAIAIILGLNIGTTITALLASIGGSTNAKRAAFAHIFFNVIGTIWILPLFYPYVHFIEKLGSMFLGYSSTEVSGLADVFAKFPDGTPQTIAIAASLTATIALSHTCFNVVNTIVFLPFMKYLAKFVTWLFPSKEFEEVPHLKYLTTAMINTPALAIEQSADEINEMGIQVMKMMDKLEYVVDNEDYDSKEAASIFKKEEILDVIQKEITQFIGKIFSKNTSRSIAADCRTQLRIADELESISDYIEKILKLYIKKDKSKAVFTKQGAKELKELHGDISSFIVKIADAVKHNNSDFLLEANNLNKQLVTTIKSIRDSHLDRMEETNASTIMVSLIFSDILNSYRRIKDHTLNVAEAVAGEK